MNRDHWKSCRCLSCGINLDPLGTMAHRAKHKRNKTDCKMRFTRGDVREWKFSNPDTATKIVQEVPFSPIAYAAFPDGLVIKAEAKTESAN